MVRRVALLLVLAAPLLARPDFVTDGTTITPKNNYKACPVGADPTRCWSATDANQHADALVALRTHTSGWANARSYGLRCDGATDDRAALVAMIATLGAANRVVVFPGSCQISGGPGIAIPANLPAWFMGGGSFVGPGGAGVTYTPANIGLATVWTLDSSVGSNCDAFGGVGSGTGQRVQSGLDNGDGGGVPNDGVLQAGEVDATAYLCDGARGALTEIDGTVGANCAAFSGTGQRIRIGLDNGDGGGTAGNYALEAGEVDATSYVCDGEQGPSVYDLWFVVSKITTASQVLAYLPVLRGMTIPQNCTLSRGYAGTLPVADRTFTFSYIRSGVPTVFATAAVAALDGAVTWTCASATALQAGDIIEWKAPSTLDSTLANVGLGMAGTLP